jgi:hypothetical protein
MFNLTPDYDHPFTVDRRHTKEMLELLDTLANSPVGSGGMISVKELQTIKELHKITRGASKNRTKTPKQVIFSLRTILSKQMPDFKWSLYLGTDLDTGELGISIKRIA